MYFSPIQYQDVNGHDYQKVPNYYGDVYRQPLQQVQEHWPVNGQGMLCKIIYTNTRKIIYYKQTKPTILRIVKNRMYRNTKIGTRITLRVSETSKLIN